MRRTSWNRQALGFAAFTAALGAAGCLPFPHMERVSPELTGTYRHLDGTPVVGLPLAVSDDSRDSTCSSVLVHGSGCGRTARA
jgi:hypothetical protein